MKKTLISIASAAFIMAFSATAFAQVQMPPSRLGGTQQPNGQDAPRMTPQMTEFYEPVPPTVTPGEFNANAQYYTAPSDAIILFDGTSLSEWENVRGGGDAQWEIVDGCMKVNKKGGDIRTKREFGDFQMHFEWRIPEGIQGSGQGRGNSGLKIGGYEIQILDGYNNETYVNGMVGSIYKQTIPLVNPSRPNGEWQVYDIIFTAPTFNKLGQYKTKPRVTLLYNGVLVLNDVEIIGVTSYSGIPPVDPNSTFKLLLQAHADDSAPMTFRNIWIREL